MRKFKITAFVLFFMLVVASVAMAAKKSSPTELVSVNMEDIAGITSASEIKCTSDALAGLASKLRGLASWFKSD